MGIKVLDYDFGEAGGFVVSTVTKKGRRGIRFWSTDQCQCIFHMVFKDEKVRWPILSMDEVVFNKMNALYNQRERIGVAPFERDV